MICGQNIFHNLKVTLTEKKNDKKCTKIAAVPLRI